MMAAAEAMMIPGAGPEAPDVSTAFPSRSDPSVSDAAIGFDAH